MPLDELHQQFNDITYSILLNNSYLKYEISNFSKPQKECLHNVHYWENDKYLGFGPSAHSYGGKKRWNNFNDLNKYISLIENNKSTIESYDSITEIKKINEIIGFGLRMVNGFDISKISTNLKNSFDEQLRQSQNKFPEMIIIDENRIKLTQTGMNFADAIAVELMIQE